MERKFLKIFQGVLLPLAEENATCEYPKTFFNLATSVSSADRFLLYHQILYTYHVSQIKLLKKVDARVAMFLFSERSCEINNECSTEYCLLTFVASFLQLVAPVSLARSWKLTETQMRKERCNLFSNTTTHPFAAYPITFASYKKSVVVSWWYFISSEREWRN